MTVVALSADAPRGRLSEASSPSAARSLTSCRTSVWICGTPDRERTHVQPDGRDEVRTRCTEDREPAVDVAMSDSCRVAG